MPRAAGVLPSHALHALLDPAGASGPAAQEVDGPRTSSSLFKPLSSSVLFLSSAMLGCFWEAGRESYARLKTFITLYHIITISNPIPTPMPNPIFRLVSSASPLTKQTLIYMSCEQTRGATPIIRRVVANRPACVFYVERIKPKTRFLQL